MTTNIGGSATIYTFPPRGRFAVGGNLDGDNAAANFTAPRMAGHIAFGGSWYHEEAIREAELGRKN